MCLSNEVKLHNPDCTLICKECSIFDTTTEVKLFKVMNSDRGVFFGSTIKDDKTIYQPDVWYRAIEEGFHAFKTIEGAVGYRDILSKPDDNFSIVEIRMKCLESRGEEEGFPAVTGRHMKIVRVVGWHELIIPKLRLKWYFY